MTKQKKISLEKKNILQNFHYLLEQENYEKIKEIFNLKNLDENINEKGYLSLVIRYLITISDFKSLKYITQKYHNYFNKRDLLNLSCFYIQNSDINKQYSILANKFFEEILSKYEINDFNLIFLIENQLIDFIKQLEGYYCPIKITDTINKFIVPFKIKSNKSLFVYSNLKKYHFNQDIINTNLEIISKAISKIKEIDDYFINIVFEINQQSLKFNNFDDISNKFIIIDGGNILFSNKAILNKISFERLILLMTKIKNLNKIPVLIIHKRHFDKKRYTDKDIDKYIDYLKNNFLYFQTPFHENDDYYILYLGLKYQLKIITNDLFGDHISILKSREDGIQTLYQTEFYIKDLQIKYIFKEFPKNLNFNEPKLLNFINLEKIENYSKCIQIIDNYPCICDHQGNYFALSKFE